MCLFCLSLVISNSWLQHNNWVLLLTVVSALSVSFFRERSLCFFPPAARTLTRVSPPIKPRQLGAPQKHFWASLLVDKRSKIWYNYQHVEYNFKKNKTILERKWLDLLPVSLELIIKSEFWPSRHSFGGEEANSELAINSPLQRVWWIRNAKQRFYKEIKALSSRSTYS